MTDAQLPFAALTVLDHAPDLVVVGRADADEPRLVWANAAFCEFAGVPLGALRDQPPSVLAMSPLAGLGPRSMGEALLRNEPLRLAIEHPSTGNTHRFEVSVFALPPQPDAPRLVAGIGRDVTTSHDHAEQLAYLASTDPMTGLANRRVFFEQLDAAWQRQQETDSQYVAMLVDVDGLKAVNDSHGTDAGDQVLVTLAQTVRQCVRERDTVARLGGEEFAVLLPDTSLADAEILAESIHRCASREPARLGGIVLPASISIGLGAGVFGDSSPTDALTRADGALQVAKDAGGTTCAAAAG